MKGGKKMEKYYVTDGKKYIKSAKGTNFSTVGSHVLAKEYDLRDAKKVLRGIQKGFNRDFYLEGVETFSQIHIADLEEKEKRGTEYIEKIGKLAKNITEFEIPSKQELNTIKRKLEEAQSFYDRALSDVHHWIKIKNPAAHIRTKVYKIQQDLERERADAKQALLFTNNLIDAVNGNLPIDQLVKRMRESQYTPYKERTYIYGVLENLK